MRGTLDGWFRGPPVRGRGISHLNRAWIAGPVDILLPACRAVTSTRFQRTAKSSHAASGSLGVTTVIELQGELDLAARKTLDDALESALHPGPVVTVVADLDAVTSADATTVAWLMHADAVGPPRGRALRHRARQGGAPATCCG